jgi:antitoxin HigA-1
MSRKQISMIVNARAAITAETAARIAEVLGTTAQYWLNLQNAVDLFDAEQALALREGDRQPRRLPAFEGQRAAA